MISIPPAGQSVNEYPKSILSQAQLEIREKSKLLSTYRGDLFQIHEIITKNIGTGIPFFTAHFGLDPVQGITDKLFTDGAGNFIDTDTPAQRLLKANEVMQYQDPSPADHGITQEALVTIVSAIPQIRKVQAKIAATEIEIADDAGAIVYGMESKPDADSVKTFFSKYKKPKLGSGSTVSQFAAKNGIQNSLYVTGGPRYFTKKVGDVTYNVQPIVDFYKDAYSKDPAYYWQKIAQVRLSIYSDRKISTYSPVVRLEEVNPNTGAPNGKYVVVAFGSQTKPGNISLSEVKQRMFPDVIISEPGRNPKVMFGQDAYYAEQLQKGQNIWKSTPEKASRPYTAIVLHSWEMPSDRFISQARDGSGSPINVYGVGPPSKVNLPNVLKVIFTLAPKGTEEAMNRIVTGSDAQPSAIEQWFESHLADKHTTMTTGQGKKLVDVAGVNDKERESVWMSERYLLQCVTKACYAALEHPWLYMEGNGFSRWIDYQARAPSRGAYADRYTMKEMFGDTWFYECVGRDDRGNDKLPPAGFLTAVREAVRQIFTLAKWPALPAQKLFEAPVNDEQDLLFIKTKFRKAMEGPDYPVPREMYLPEKLNRDLRFSPQLHDEASGAQSSQQGSTNRYAYYFTNNSTGGAPYKPNNKRYMYNMTKVYYHARYTKKALGVRTRKPVTLPGGAQLTMVSSSPDQSPPGLNTLGDSSLAGAIGVTGAVVGLGMLGMTFLRNR